jgi:YegS/Rv2252/BmrU family lipid kinase
MDCKKACVVINPRAGENLAKITDVLAVLAAAGWSTDLAIKEYGGHTMKLAQQAAADKYDLVIVYGGDGTLNQVVNGVMNANSKHSSSIGLIPGGTANVWASEVGIPADPVKAALTLINSDARKVDIGHIEITELTFPNTTETDSGQQGQSTNNGKAHTRKVKASSKARHHFLLMAGLGIDAAIMGSVSKPLKYHIGPLAVGLSAVKKLPEQHPFPVELSLTSGANKGDLLWKGEAIQVVIGNTRRYADVVQMTPDAYIDDGILDVCVITAGDPLTTVQQVTSLLLRRKPDNLTAEYFRGAHFSITIPASIDLQLDGSAVKLKDYLSKSDRQALKNAENLEQVMVTYQFDAMPRALQVAIPRKYDDTLFERESAKKELHAQAQEHTGEEEHAEMQQQEAPAQQNGQEVPGESRELVDALLDNGREITIVGAVPNSGKQKTYIVAGGEQKQNTGEVKPVAVCIDEDTAIFKQSGEKAPPAIIPELQEGTVILVEGKKSKRGVVQAKRVVV